MTDTKPQYYCRKCPESQTLDTLVKDRTRPRGYKFICLNCAKIQSREYYRLNVEREKARATKRYNRVHKKRRARNDALYEREQLDEHYIYIPAEPVREWLDQLVEQHGTMTVVSELVGVSTANLSLLRAGKTKSARLETADAIALLCDKQVELSELIGEGGRAGWNKAGDRYCQLCGTHHHPHFGRGKCEKCFWLVHHGSKALPRDQRTGWCAYAPRCKDCGTQERPHRCRGLCQPCYRRNGAAGTLERFPALTTRRAARKQVRPPEPVSSQYTPTRRYP